MLSNHSEDKDLWRKFQLGNELAFAQMYKNYQQDLFSYAYRILHDRDEAKSVLHELFAYLWENRQKLPIIESPKAYLITALRRNAIRQYKKNRFFAIDPADIVEDGIADGFVFSSEDLLIAEEQSLARQKLLTEVINRLPKRQREIIYLRYYQELTIPQIAQALEVSYQTVANHLQYAYKTLSQQKSVRMLLAISVWLSLLIITSSIY